MYDYKRGDRVYVLAVKNGGPVKRVYGTITSVSYDSIRGQNMYLIKIDDEHKNMGYDWLMNQWWPRDSLNVAVDNARRGVHMEPKFNVGDLVYIRFTTYEGIVTDVHGVVKNILMPYHYEIKIDEEYKNMGFEWVERKRWPERRLRHELDCDMAGSEELL